MFKLIKLIDLRLALRIDALASGAMGAVLLAAANPLHDQLGAPVATMRATGAFLIVFALALWGISMARTINADAARSVVVANATWVVASITVVALGVLDLTGLGIVFVLGQAAAVIAFADLQVLGLRRLPTS